MTDYDKQGDAYRHWYLADSPYWLIEQTRFFQVLGSVRNLRILELACGDGRISRMLIDRGAREVVGTDISEQMIERAVELNTDDRGGLIYPGIKYQVVDASDRSFQLEDRVDLVTAMYLFHYAPSTVALEDMCNLISRNLKADGRFVAYTINPAYDFTL
jgi:SAM-dependent methyltransferase